MNFNHFEKGKSTLKFDGIVAKVYHREFDSGKYEYVVLPDAARTVAVTDDGRIIVIKEKLFSFDREYFSLPGGAVEDGESPEEAALRELEEETGYFSNDIELWFQCNYSQTIINNKFFFVARSCRKKGGGKLDRNEKIEVETLDYDNFINCVTREEFKNIELQNKFLKIKINNEENERFKGLLKMQEI